MGGVVRVLSMHLMQDLCIIQLVVVMESCKYLRLICCKVNLSFSFVMRHFILLEPSLHLLHILLHLQLLGHNAPTQVC